MEQYLNFIWKNYTTSNSDNQLFDEDNDGSDFFTGNDLHYKIPFWIGVIVISLLLLCAIIATIRYCIQTLCLPNNEPETITLMPKKSPCFSSNTARTNAHHSSRLKAHNLSDDNETSSSSSPEQLRDHHSTISFVPIIHEHSRSHFSHRKQLNMDDNENENHYFSPNECRSPVVDFRKKMHDIYVLPVSPTLSSEENIKNNWNTMPNRSRTYNRTNHGIQNDCFDESPKPKTRTLPRSQTNTSRHIQPPSVPPPLPPTIAHFQHQLSVAELDRDSMTLRFNSFEEHQLKNGQPPPVPSRTQKPSVLPIGFEEIIKQSDEIDFRLMAESSSPQTDCSEHSWPNPPESMCTSQISQRLSIPYDHLIPTLIIHQTNPTQFLQQYRHIEHSMLTESDS